MMSLASTCIVMLTFSSISSVVGKIYGVSSTVVSFAFSFFLMTIVCFNFIAVYVLEVVGLNITFRVSAIGIIGACWLRYFVLKETGDFVLFLIPQALVAVFQPFLYDAISKIATRWFADDQRALATTFGSLADPIGCIIGILIGPFYIAEGDEDDPETGKQKVCELIFIQAIICTVMCIPVLVGF